MEASRIEEFEQHYKQLDRVVSKAPIPYMYIVNVCITLGCVIAAAIVDGKELILALYIPLDIAITLSKFCFYWFIYF